MLFLNSVTNRVCSLGSGKLAGGSGRCRRDQGYFVRRFFRLPYYSYDLASRDIKGPITLDRRLLITGRVEAGREGEIEAILA
jgi:hypothetical protein